MLRINSATKDLPLVRSFETPDWTRVRKKSRSFARAQDDTNAILGL